MKVLFISHDASRTGAPIMLLRFIKFLKNNVPGFEGILILRASGPLKSEFQKYVEVIEFLPNIYYPSDSLFTTYYRKITLRNYRLKLLYKLYINKYDLIFSNTIVNLDVLKFLSPLKLKVLIYFHELQNTVEHFGGASLIEQTDKVAKYYIAVSQASAKCLENYGVKSSKISVVYNSLEIDPIDVKPSVLELPKNVTQEETFIIGGCGSIIHLKGYDLFLEVANIVVNEKGYRNFNFLWAGHFAPKEVMQEIEQQVLSMGLSNNVKFIGQVINTFTFFNSIDLLLFTSRGDAFGLTAIEAGVLEKPTICFEGSGGVVEFVSNDCGVRVPYLDVYAMAEAVIRLYIDSVTRQELGLNAKNKVLSNHLQETQLNKIINIINSI